MASQNVFLDTSIQIERFLQTRQRQLQLERHIAASNLQFVTSHYVYMEFQRSIIADYATIHRCLLQYQDWSEVGIGLSSGKQAFRARSMARSIQILTRIMALSQMDKNIAISMVEALLNRELVKRFWYKVSPINDSIVCDLVQTEAQRLPDASYDVPNSCRKATASCNLPAFLETERPKLRTIAHYLTEHPAAIKSQERVERLLEKVLTDPKESLGQSACWPLGDIVIALQVPSDTYLWTTDRDLVTLCHAINVPLYNPVF